MEVQHWQHCPVTVPTSISHNLKVCCVTWNKAKSMVQCAVPTEGEENGRIRSQYANLSPTSHFPCIHISQ
jgi:hypothetical protein